MCPVSLHRRWTLGSFLLISSGLCPNVPFPIANVTVDPFVVIDFRATRQLYADSVSPSNKSLKLGAVLGTQTQNVIHQEREHKSRNRFYWGGGDWKI